MDRPTVGGGTMPCNFVSRFVHWSEHLFREFFCASTVGGASSEPAEDRIVLKDGTEIRMVRLRPEE